MGEVWKARDRRLDRIVAIKTLKGPHTGRFEQEARAIAALNHPNVCTLYDIGPDYMVMEFIDGEPLRGPIGADAVVRLARQIASALESAHEHGVLHRDLKPANVLVCSGSIKLLDFGIATLRGLDPEATRTTEGAVVGTVAYMSPEQAVGKAVDERSDIFSLGAVPYELMSGERAFAGESAAEVLSAILRDDPRPLEAPEALGRITMRCLRKLPVDRFQRMRDVRIALENYAEPWSDRYDRELADVFAVQDEIAGAITKALSARLSIGEPAGRQHTPTLAAYEAYLKGRHRLWLITPESLHESREFFQQAIAADPRSAAAYTGLSHHSCTLTMFSLMPARQAMPQVRANAQRALELEPSLPDAHAMLGIVAALYDYDWNESSREFGI